MRLKEYKTMKQEREDSYNHILKYTGIFGGVQGLNILIGLVRNKIVAVLLGPGGMGLASLFNTVVSFISQATNLGLSFSAVRHVSELFDRGDEQRIAHFVQVVRAWSLLTALLGMLVCILAGPLLSSQTFSWGDHTLHFVMLSPAVAMLAITGGETAILKGARKLKDLAIIQLFSVFVALLISVPIYYFYNQSGIVPVIVLMAFSSMLFTLRFSYRLYPLQLSGSKGILGEGMEMVRLGIAFVMAGILGSGAEMFIRSYLNVEGDLDVVGFYNAGFMLTVTYAGMVFTAMETDYFPRLSAISANRREMRQVVNRQIEVSLLMVSPMLCLFMIAMPIIIPILFTSEFNVVIGMAQVAVLSMYIKAVSLPISYLTLAHGDSVAFLVLEACFDVVMVLFVIWGYHYLGLFGTGLGLTLSYLLDILIVYGNAYFRYGYRVSGSVLQYASILIPLGVAAYIVTLIENPVMYWLLGSILCFVSFAVSIHVLRQKTSLWEAFMNKLKVKLNDGEA